MSRLTENDWKIINRALALLEASVGDMYEEDEAKAARAINRVRAKVQERL